jgi:hypothetical protein
MPSSVIGYIKYDPVSETLSVQYLSGAVYNYKAVPKKIYKEMRASVSKGRYLNYKIKGKYEFEKVV